MPVRLYQPPPGFYDLPFTWVYDANSLTDGLDYFNQFIYLLGGYGDFILRRVVGLNRILRDDGTGLFQIRDGDGDFMQSAPTVAVSADQMIIAPEAYYKEQRAIRFDLQKILKQVGPQIAFQGVRRLPGGAPGAPGRVQPKFFQTQVDATLSNPAPTSPTTVYLKVNDFDFELYQLMVLQLGNASLQVSIPDVLSDVYTLIAIEPGLPGNLISFEITGANVPNTVAQVTVIGKAISVQMGNDGGGNPTSTFGDLFTLMQASPDVAALVTLAMNPAATGLFPLDYGPQFLSGGEDRMLTDAPRCYITIYDQNRTACSNQPVLDTFYNGAPDALYENGAIVPPLYYRKDSTVKFDVWPLSTDPAQFPITIRLYLIGRQLNPCA